MELITFGILGDSPSEKKVKKIFSEIINEQKNPPSITYKKLSDKHLPALESIFKNNNLAGIYCLDPFRIEVKYFLDDLSTNAKHIRETNLICIKNEKLFGFNTEGIGFIAMLKDNGIDIQNKTFTIIGGGNVARSIGLQLGKEGALQVDVVCNDPEIGLDLTNYIRETTSADSNFILWNSHTKISPTTNILINAKYGLNSPPFNFEVLSPKIIACDVNIDEAKPVFCDKIKKYCHTLFTAPQYYKYMLKESLDIVMDQKPVFD
ncbi:MAG: hypothetical protein OEY34_08895 [Cyclobacteriaceae bacterium]|nr:hypothetical protein [Cyclobacteriaceae bacterium]